MSRHVTFTDTKNLSRDVVFINLVSRVYSVSFSTSSKTYHKVKETLKLWKQSCIMMTPSLQFTKRSIYLSSMSQGLLFNLYYNKVRKDPGNEVVGFHIIGKISSQIIVILALLKSPDVIIGNKKDQCSSFSRSHLKLLQLNKKIFPCVLHMSPKCTL